jgi:hypothetical protein
MEGFLCLEMIPIHMLYFNEITIMNVLTLLEIPVFVDEEHRPQPDVPIDFQSH